MIPSFENKADLYDWLIANKSTLIATKKAAIKEADAVGFTVPVLNDKEEVIKAEVTEDTTRIKVRAIINTTKLMDSHSDVHIDGLWNKSIKETKDNYLVKQHDFSFEGIISDEVKVSAKIYTWKELGFSYEGSTQALVYDAVIDKAESPVMFKKYVKGQVKQHSVGMRYISMKMAINDERYPEEKNIWDKYINEIANKEDAEQQGFFWAITEAKNIEGSAVVRGSNHATPTQSVSAAKDSTDIEIEPVLTTQKQTTFLNTNLY